MAGPMMYLEKAAGLSQGGSPLRIFRIPAAFGMGSMVQANAISETVSYVYGIPEAAVGMILVGPCGYRAGRRRTADLSRGGAACSIVCGALYGSSAGQ